MISRYTGVFYSHDGNFIDAEKAFRSALAQLEQARARDPEVKNVALAEAYSDLSGVSSDLKHNAKALAYQRRSVALGGALKDGTQHFNCFNYYRLKQYRDGVAECTQVIERSDNTETHYWRGRIYEDLKDKEAALKDMAVVAASQHPFKRRAVTSMSILYGDDAQAALDILNKYPELYDSKHEGNNALGVMHNNRCYAEMRLHMLKEALADCELSIHYESSPEAVQKRDELKKQLGM